MNKYASQYVNLMSAMVKTAQGPRGRTGTVPTSERQTFGELTAPLFQPLVDANRRSDRQLKDFRGRIFSAFTGKPYGGDVREQAVQNAQRTIDINNRSVEAGTHPNPNASVVPPQRTFDYVRHPKTGVPGSQNSKPLATPLSSSAGLAAANAPIAAASAPAASPPASGGPSDEWLAKTMGSYDPNSKRDQMKADRIRSMWREGMSHNDVYADPEYKRIDAEKLWRK